MAQKSSKQAGQEGRSRTSKAKVRVWSVDKADEEFSKYIRARDGKCMYPRCPKPSDTEGLQCSHFWGRAIWILRFDPRNCDAAHAGCHYFHWEKDKQGEYKQFKIDQLGQEAYDELEEMAMDYKHGKRKTSQRSEIIKVMEFLENHEGT